MGNKAELATCGNQPEQWWNMHGSMCGNNEKELDTLTEAVEGCFGRKLQRYRLREIHHLRVFLFCIYLLFENFTIIMLLLQINTVVSFSSTYLQKVCHSCTILTPSPESVVPAGLTAFLLMANSQTIYYYVYNLYIINSIKRLANS